MIFESEAGSRPVGLWTGLLIVAAALVVCWWVLRLVLRETVRLSEGVARDHRRDGEQAETQPPETPRG